jgi:hypothetical protein
MRILLRDGATHRSSAHFEALLMQLRAAGIPIAGGGRLGEDDEAILIDRDSDADRRPLRRVRSNAKCTGSI